MRIAHISDVHIRNLKYHLDYRRVFDNLYKKLREFKPDIVINTGDTAHTKTQISPEFVEMTSEHVRNIIEIAPYHIILGNHDLNLMNSDRQDAITPIIESIRDPRVHLHKKSGPVEIDQRVGDKPVILWVFGIGDSENYPKPDDWDWRTDDVNIGLFHGSVLNCVTDSNWRMTHTEQELSLFSGLDYVLMGDIHKQQFMDSERKIGYAGSLVQQNFGEDVDKGFLIWDIESKKKHKVFPVYLKGSRPFITLDLNEDKTIPNVSIPEDARLRIRPKTPMTLIEQKAIERQVKKKFKPHDVITLSIANIGSSRSSIGKENVAHENLRKLEVQERLIRQFLKEKGLTEKVLAKIMDLNRKFQVELEQREGTARNVSWKLKKIAWSNLFNYGENNFLDLSAINGLTGIFAPNASGKSNLIDVMMQTLFDSTTKGISKNIFIINDNKDKATSIAEFEAEGQDYILERTIERIKYGHNSGPVKEWGKTAVNFYGVTADGVKDTLNGVSRPETERAIRRRVGTFDDAMLTDLFAQWNPMDVIQCKETERKRILYRFLDLDIFEQKGELGKKEAREYFDKLRDLEDSQIFSTITSMKNNISSIEMEISTLQKEIEDKKLRIKNLDEQVLHATSKKVKVDCDVDGPTEAGKVASARLDLTRFEKEFEGRLEALKDAQEKLRLVQLDSVQLTDEQIKTYESKISRLKEIDTKLSTLKNGVGGLNKDASVARKNLTLLQEVPCGDQFPQCKFLVNAFEGKKTLPLIQEKVDKAVGMIDKLEVEKQDLGDPEKYLKAYKEVNQKETLAKLTVENVLLQVNNVKLKIKAKEDERDAAMARIQIFEKSEGLINKNKSLDMSISSLKFEKTQAQKEMDRKQTKLSELHMSLGSEQGILSKIEEQQKELFDLRDLCAAYEHFCSAMGKDGIAFDILKQKLPLLNEEINKILSSAADFNVYVEHSSEDESIRIYIQYGEYKQRLIELGSGAEKFMSSIAIRNALMNISNLPKTNMFIIDEGFGKLDPKNMENINRMFDYLRTVFDHIIVISHSDVMKDMVDNMIDITTDEEGYAHVEVG